MSVDELNALKPGTLIYIPAVDDVLVWEFSGPVHNRSWYTLTHPPDQNGEILNRRPVYASAMDLLHSTLDERSAWEYVQKELIQRNDWISKRKLNHG